MDVSSPSVRPQATPSSLHFHRADVQTWLKNCLKKNSIQAKTAILDPPRSGLGDSHKEIAFQIESLGVTQIISVGCDVDSWVRDVANWVKRGWEIHKILLIDFFPQTFHVESVALLLHE